MTSRLTATVVITALASAIVGLVLGTIAVTPAEAQGGWKAAVQGIQIEHTRVTGTNVITIPPDCDDPSNPECSTITFVTDTATAACPDGYIVTGGGFSASSAFAVKSSASEGNGWKVVIPSAANNEEFTAQADCIRLASTP